MPFPDITLCRSGYGRNLNGQSRVTDFDTHQRIRRSCRRRGCTDTVCWVCTGDQCRALEQYHRQQQTNWFELMLPGCDGLVKTTVRFTGPLTIKPVADHYEITASLYVPEPPVMTRDRLETAMLDIIGITGSGFEHPLHPFVQQHWPTLMQEGL